MKFTVRHPDIEAVQWTGFNVDEVLALDPKLKHDRNFFWLPKSSNTYLLLHRSDYVVRYSDGRLAQIPVAIFEETYKAVDVPHQEGTPMGVLGIEHLQFVTPEMDRKNREALAAKGLDPISLALIEDAEEKIQQFKKENHEDPPSTS